MRERCHHHTPDACVMEPAGFSLSHHHVCVSVCRSRPQTFTLSCLHGFRSTSFNVHFPPKKTKKQDGGAPKRQKKLFRLAEVEKLESR